MSKPQVASFRIKMSIKVKKEEKYFVAGSPILNIWSQGETEKGALKNAVEAIQLFIESCFDRGTLEDVLKECGFVSFSKIVQTSEKDISDEKPADDGFETDIDIPLAIAN